MASRFMSHHTLTQRVLPVVAAGAIATTSICVGLLNHATSGPERAVGAGAATMVAGVALFAVHPMATILMPVAFTSYAVGRKHGMTSESRAAVLHSKAI